MTREGKRRQGWGGGWVVCSEKNRPPPPTAKQEGARNKTTDTSMKRSRGKWCRVRSPYRWRSVQTDLLFIQKKRVLSRIIIYRYQKKKEKKKRANGGRGDKGSQGRGAKPKSSSFHEVSVGERPISPMEVFRYRVGSAEGSFWKGSGPRGRCWP